MRFTSAVLAALAATSICACEDDGDDDDDLCEPVDAGVCQCPSMDASCPAPSDGGALDSGTTNDDDPTALRAQDLVEQGRQAFRYDTFGDEAFWGDQLGLHEAIAGAANGGVGAGLTPTAALGLGLKVDSEALPEALVEQITAGEVDLEDPATTIALLRLNAVVGVTGFFDGEDQPIRSIGIQCALCHATVDDSFAPGIGRRLDGWPNRDLDVGQIIALAPSVAPYEQILGVDEATVRTVLQSWGPGKFDAELILDGQAFRPDGESAATVLPPAFGLAGVNLHTYTGWGSVPYWNAFVAILLMRGQGTFYDPRLDDAERFPVAARNGFSRVVPTGEDRLTPVAAALHVYQLSLPIPTPPADRFDAAAAARGRALFEGEAQCATCHTPPLYAEPGWNMHTPEEIGIDSFQADRSPYGMYRTTPLGGLFTREQGGFYHDGRFPTLEAVVDHYDQHLGLDLTPAEHADLVQFLRSL
jgi:hypothetical protein